MQYFFCFKIINFLFFFFFARSLGRQVWMLNWMCLISRLFESTGGCAKNAGFKFLWGSWVTFNIWPMLLCAAIVNLCCSDVLCHYLSTLWGTQRVWGRLSDLNEPANTQVTVSTFFTDMRGHAVSKLDSFICCETLLDQDLCFILCWHLYYQLNSWAGMSTQGRDHASHKTANSEGPINS